MYYISIIASSFVNCIKVRIFCLTPSHAFVKCDTNRIKFIVYFTILLLKDILQLILQQNINLSKI